MTDLAYQEAPFYVMTPEVFPHGLRCATCSREIIDGQPFKHSFHEMWEDGTVMTIALCVYCPPPQPVSERRDHART